MMVELGIVGVGSSVNSSEPSVASGRVIVATRNGTLPNAIVSPGLTLPSVTRAPLTNVPLLDPRSRTRIVRPSLVSSAWRREMVGSKTGRSLTDARPTTKVAPSCSSKDWSPAVLVRRKGMTRNMSPARGPGDWRLPRAAARLFLRQSLGVRTLYTRRPRRALSGARPRLFLLLETKTNRGNIPRSIRRLDQAHPVARRPPEQRAGGARQRAERVSEGQERGEPDARQECARGVEEDARRGRRVEEVAPEQGRIRRAVDDAGPEGRRHRQRVGRDA